MKTLISSLALLISAAISAQTIDDIKPDHWIIPSNQGDGYTVPQVPASLKGKVVILDFWFTQCAPCVASIPNFNALAKNNPDIVVLSIVFDNDAKINKFLKTMIVDYPIGVDTSEAVIKKFKVTGYPETFVFDKTGKLAWKGWPYNMPQKLVASLLNKSELKGNFHQKGDVPKKDQFSSYSFSMEKHVADNGGGTFSQTNPFEITYFNYTPAVILSQLYGVNRSRLISPDSSIYKDYYDVRLKADEKMTTSANCPEMMKYLCLDRLGYEMKQIKKPATAYLVTIENDTLFRSAKTKVKYSGFGSSATRWNGQGQTLKELCTYLENQFNVIIPAEPGTDRYDFSIPITDFEAARAELRTMYGISLHKGIKEDVEFWEISKKQ